MQHLLPERVLVAERSHLRLFPIRIDERPCALRPRPRRGGDAVDRPGNPYAEDVGNSWQHVDGEHRAVVDLARGLTGRLDEEGSPQDAREVSLGDVAHPGKVDA